MKLSRKHIAIFRKIESKGKYKPTYSDQEPATKTLIKAGYIDWNERYTGLVMTTKGLEFWSGLKELERTV